MIHICDYLSPHSPQMKQDMLGELGRIQSQVAHRRQQLELEPEDYRDCPGNEASLLTRRRYWMGKLEVVTQLKEQRLEEIRRILDRLGTNFRRVGDPLPEGKLA